MNHLETGVQATAVVADAAIPKPGSPASNSGLVWNGSTWVAATIVNANIDAAAAIAYTKLNLAGGIVNNDIASAAAIAFSKLAVFPFDWVAISQTLTYSSTDGHTFVVTTGGVDLTGTIPVGSRIKLTHSASVKYFIVTAIDATTITLYGGTDYSLTATAITLPSYSQAKTPLGFPANPTKWTEELVDTTDRSQANATNATWINPAALTLAIPIGAWDVRFEGVYYINDASHSGCSGKVTLSTGTTTESDTQFTTYLNLGAGSAAPNGMACGFARRKFLVLASKTSYFANFESLNTFNTSTIQFYGSTGGPTIIRAVCAYL